MVKEEEMTKLLRLKDVLDRVGLSKSMIYKLISQDEFPAAIKIFQASRWSESSIEDWVQGKIKESSAD